MDWLIPWYEVGGEEVAESLRAELLREVPPGHVLRGAAAVKALGYRKDQDDVAFALPDGRVAVVHLTWARREAMPPDHPATDLLDSVEAFKQLMETHHRELAQPNAVMDSPPTERFL
jgi:hypothetical protein